MPLKDYLLQITRMGQNTWEVKKLLSVTFASLVQPQPGCPSQPIEPCKRFWVPLQKQAIPFNEKFSSFSVVCKPLKLTEICRSAIRVALRRNIEIEHPNLRNPKRRRARKNKKSKVPRLVVPILQDSDNDSSQDDRIVGVLRSVQRGIDHDEPERRLYAAQQVLNIATLSSSDTTEYEAGDESSMSNERGKSEPEENYTLAKFNSVIQETEHDDDEEEEDPNCNSSEEVIDDCKQILAAVEDSCTSTCSSCADVSGASGASRRLFRTRRSNNAILWKRFAREDVETDSDDANDEQTRKECSFAKVSGKPDLRGESYTKYMRERISLLPLPDFIKSFVNFNRPLN